MKENSKYNLLDENRIEVIIDKKGNTAKVGLKDFFTNSHKYIAFGGDTKSQDFAVMRVMLSILHTVFSRFDDEGKVYPQVQLDEKFKQIEDVDQDDVDDYSVALFETWENLWNKKEFPQIINIYLEKWRDHFNLIDENYPFYQVLYKDISGDFIKAKTKTPANISAKNINRRINQSGNKEAFFAPRDYETRLLLNFDEVTRWLITYQQYTGMYDKDTYNIDKEDWEKGWLFKLGGVYLEGNNLFETLMLNLILDRYKIDDGENNKQSPIWEKTHKEIKDKMFSKVNADNLAELYTRPSRSVNINQDHDESEEFYLHAVKLPKIDERSFFLEPMTIWRFNKTGKYRDAYTPREHNPKAQLRRSFGMLVKESPEYFDRKYKRPGVFEWLYKIEPIIDKKDIKIVSIGMKPDGNASSQMPAEEIYDYLAINSLLVNDKDNRASIIEEVVEETKKKIEFTFKNFLSDLSLIRSEGDSSFIDKDIELIYFFVDREFRDRLRDLKEDDDKDEKVFLWRKTLYEILINQANEILKNTNSKDHMGKNIKRKKNDKKEEYVNAFIAFNRLSSYLRRGLKSGESND